MGLLTVGKPLTWTEIRSQSRYVRQHGIKQFINMYKNSKDICDMPFKCGDEIEYLIVKFDHDHQMVRVSLRGQEILAVTDEMESREADNRPVLWRPEVCAFQLEGTPGKPFGVNDNTSIDNFSYVKDVEINMRTRREELKLLLDKDEALITMTAFPRLGTQDCTHPYTEANRLSSQTKSIFLADQTLQECTPKYRSVEQSVRSRRGRKMAINIPIFKDIKTPDPFVEVFDDEESNNMSKIDHIYMDSFVAGCGCCALQVTQQGRDLAEALLIYDQLTPFTPIASALSAATAIQRGYMTDEDHRWHVLEGSVDDRTREELGEIPLSGRSRRLFRSRCSSIESYLSDSCAQYNDIPLDYDQGFYDEMIEEGVPHSLALHFAHIFIRDPLFLYWERLHQNDETESDHFEVIQSQNWLTIRLKPPTPQTTLGWRVEFRPMETQLTDFENAAYVVFIVLLSRVILAYELNFLIPISKVDENMSEALKRDAVNRSKFWFRKSIFTSATPQEVVKYFDRNNNTDSPKDDSCGLMTVDHIINGKDNQFPGLLPVIRHFLDGLNLEAETRATIDGYMELISGSQWSAQDVRQMDPRFRPTAQPLQTRLCGQ